MSHGRHDEDLDKATSHAFDLHISVHANLHLLCQSCMEQHLHSEKVATHFDKASFANLQVQGFDAVVVCVGTYSQPHLPEDTVRGIPEFRGRQLHSHNFRRPEIFRGQRVLVVGASFSGKKCFSFKTSDAGIIKDSYILEPPFLQCFCSLSELLCSVMTLKCPEDHSTREDASSAISCNLITPASIGSRINLLGC